VETEAVTASDFSTVQYFSPLGGDIFPTRPDPVWGLPSLLHIGYRVIPGGKAAGTWRYLPTTSHAEVRERVELYFYFPTVPSRHVTSELYLFLYCRMFLLCTH
jgi:hypothetical protein